MSDVVRVETLKSDLSISRTVSFARPELEEGQVRARVERVAVTSNNMSYAVFGESLGYWNLFPALDADYGCMPTWGFAQVTESRVEEIAVGTRCFGYFPLATEIVMEPTAVTSRGFIDGLPHRIGTPEVYNLYEFKPRVASPRLESLVAMFRPLFITSYTAVDFLRERDHFGARQIVIASASSKTAYGIAHCLTGNSSPRIALTSPRNVDFVGGLGCYDEVVEYADLAAIDPEVPTLYIDLSNEPALRRRVHEHLGDNLVYDCLVGATQGSSLPDEDVPDETLPGPQPRFFFAATQLDAYKAAGQSRVFMERYERAEFAFIERVDDPDHPWVRIEAHRGLAEAPDVITQLHDGTVNPSLGHIFELAPGDEHDGRGPAVLV